MTEPANSYWSIDSCAWVSYSRSEVEVPAQRPADGVDEVRDLDAVDLPEGVPV